jgi:hypothetical protein
MDRGVSAVPPYAAGELSEARTELASADQAVKDERMALAERLKLTKIKSTG